MPQTDMERARFNMIEQQIRPWDVLDPRVLSLIGESSREDYVPELYRSLAFADMNIPIGHGQVMMAPKLEARLLQALDIEPTDTILEIGTGSGYLTSLLAKLGKHVYSVEINPELKQEAKKKLGAHNITNVTLEVGDGARGWDAHKPYDVIVVTGSLPVLPDTFREALAIKGRLFAIVGKSPVMEARLIRRLGERNWTESSLFETELPALANAEEPPKFVF